MPASIRFVVEPGTRSAHCILCPARLRSLNTLKGHTTMHLFRSKNGLVLTAILCGAAALSACGDDDDGADGGGVPKDMGGSGGTDAGTSGMDATSGRDAGSGRDATPGQDARPGDGGMMMGNCNAA